MKRWQTFFLMMTTLSLLGGNPVEDRCVSGDMNACYETGKGYLEGVNGFPKDKETAGEYLQLACDGDVEDACRTLKSLNHPTRPLPSETNKQEITRDKSLRNIPKEGYRWRHFMIPKVTGWYINTQKSNAAMLVLQTTGAEVDVVVLKKDIFSVNQHYRNEILRQLSRSFRNDPEYQHVRVHAHSGIRVLSDPSASELSADGDGLRVHAFLPYHRGRFYFVMALNKLPRSSLSREQKRMLDAIRIGGSR